MKEYSDLKKAYAAKILSTYPEIESILNSDALPLFKSIHDNLVITLKRLNCEYDVEKKQIQFSCLFYTTSDDMKRKDNALISYLISESGIKEFESIICKITNIPFRVIQYYFAPTLSLHLPMSFLVTLKCDDDENIKLIGSQYAESTLLYAMRYLELQNSVNLENAE